MFMLTPETSVRQVLARLVLELPDALIRIRERERLEERLAAALDDLALRVSLFGDASPRDFRSFRAVVAQEKDTTERVRELLLDLREKVGGSSRPPRSLRP